MAEQKMNTEEKFKKLQKQYDVLKRRRKVETQKMNTARIKAFHKGQSYMRDKIAQIFPEAKNVYVDYIEPTSFHKVRQNETLRRKQI